MLHEQDILEPRQQSDVDAFMRQHHWSLTGRENLDATGIIQAGRYTGAACSGEIRILVMDPTGDTAGVITELAHEGDRIFFVHDGATFKDPPEYAPFRQQPDRALQGLHVPGFHVSPYLAIAAPAQCHIDTILPWAAL
jgi:hypothetical protein